MVKKTDNRVKTVLSVIAVQAALTLLAGIIALGFSSWHAAYSAVLGGVICVAGTAYSGVRAFFGRRDFDSERFLRRFYMAETQKLILMALLLVLIIKYGAIMALPLMLTFTMVSVMGWLILLI